MLMNRRCFIYALLVFIVTNIIGAGYILSIVPYNAIKKHQMLINELYDRKLSCGVFENKRFAWTANQNLIIDFFPGEKLDVSVSSNLERKDFIIHKIDEMPSDLSSYCKVSGLENFYISASGYEYYKIHEKHLTEVSWLNGLQLLFKSFMVSILSIAFSCSVLTLIFFYRDSIFYFLKIQPKS